MHRKHFVGRTDTLYMKQGFLIVSLLLSPAMAIAIPYNWYASWGMGVDHSDTASYSDVQNYAMGAKYQTEKLFDLFTEFGGWKDTSHFEGAKSSLYYTLGVTFDIKASSHYAYYSIAPCGISAKDSLLGHNLQVFHKIGVGFREGDKRIGLFLNHFSNAGVFNTSNIGRQFMGIEISF